MSKFSVKVNTQNVISALKTALESPVKSTQVKEKIIKFTVDRIKAFARTGNSLVAGEKKKLPTLSKSYQDFKKGKATFWTSESGAVIRASFRSRRLDQVGPFFRPASKTSNLTFTGQLLESLESKVVGNNIEIIIPDSGRSDSKETNAQIYRYLLELNKEYAILGLDQTGIERIKNIALTEIRKQIGLVFKQK